MKKAKDAICPTKALATKAAFCARVELDVASSDSLNIRTVKNPDINAATTAPFDTSHSVPTTQVTVQSALVTKSAFASSSVSTTWPCVSTRSFARSPSPRWYDMLSISVIKRIAMSYHLAQLGQHHDWDGAHQRQQEKVRAQHAEELQPDLPGETQLRGLPCHGHGTQGVVFDLAHDRHAHDVRAKEKSHPIRQRHCVDKQNGLQLGVHDTDLQAGNRIVSGQAVLVQRVRPVVIGAQPTRAR
eukprot:SAG31_NODE_1254_length_9087_cov_12.553071_4_plen_243_part_00